MNPNSSHPHEADDFAPKKKMALLLSYSGSDYCGWQKQKGELECDSTPRAAYLFKHSLKNFKLFGSAPESEGEIPKEKNREQHQEVLVEMPQSDLQKNHQRNLPSIQATLEQALSHMIRQPIRVVGSGRTDAGVHATGQVAHFVMNASLLKRSWDETTLCRGLNGILPQSIRVLAVREVPIEFHAQRSAVQKQYSYYFQQGPCALPHLVPYSRWIAKQLDVEAMREALSYLLGEYDFKPFQASGAKPGPTVRRILKADLSLEKIAFPGFGPELGDEAHQTELSQHSLRLRQEVLGLRFVRIRLIGTGFLKQMVRGIAGTLLQIGEGRRPATDMRVILESQNRKLVGPTAPARALWLERVWYSDFEF